MLTPGCPDSITDEATLIERAAHGDTAAFTDLFHLYHAMIYAFAYRLCLDRAEAQDIAQDTFVNVARALGGFSAEKNASGTFRSWLYRIALNAARDRQRRQRRRENMHDEFARRQATENQVSPAPFTGVEAALAALPDDLRRAIVLVFYEEMSHAQAAAVLGCAESTVSWRIFQAKRRLRKSLLPRE